MMAATLLLDTQTWDLVLDSSGNMAVATAPYALAQDAASAIKTFLGEVFFDSTIGVPWLQQILGQPLSLALLKQQLAVTAETVPDVASAQVFISSFNNRVVTGQVQTTSVSTGQTSAASFSVINPQGNG
jgi:hypothetical protein